MQRFKDVIRKLTNLIHESHKKEWYIQWLLAFTITPITQQRIATIMEALEQAMKIETGSSYPSSMKLLNLMGDNSLSHIQNQIVTLNEKIEELTNLVWHQPRVWCIGCHIEGHHIIECPWLSGTSPSTPPVIPPTRPMGGVA